MESLFINPLSRYLFDNEIFDNKEIMIEQINADKMPYSLICSEK